MTREEIIRNLKYTIEKHKNDTVSTFDTNISVMCKDILDYLEQENTLEKIRAEIEDTGAYEQEVHGRTEFLEGINYCLGVFDKYKIGNGE